MIRKDHIDVVYRTEPEKWKAIVEEIQELNGRGQPILVGTATVEASEKLSGHGVAARVVDMHTISPLDKAEIRAAAAETGAILTVEEHNITGGLGSAVAEVLVDCNRIPFARHGVPDEFAPIGPPAALYAYYRLDSDGIASRALELLRRA